MKKQWMIIGILLVMIGVIFYQNRTQDNQNPVTAAEELPKVNFKAPPFTLDSLDGKKITVAGPSAKPFVINFWASWCGPCKLEAPELERLYQKYGNQIEIYAVNLTTQDSISSAKSFADQYQFSFPVLLDQNTQLPVSGTYQVQAIPTTYFVNKNGIIVDKIMGYAGTDALNAKFKSLLD